MAEHHGVDARRIADGALRIGVEIAATDAYGSDVDLDLARPGIGNRLFGEMKFALRDEFGN
jgi:hypothetical protein